MSLLSKIYNLNLKVHLKCNHSPLFVKNHYDQTTDDEFWINRTSSWKHSAIKDIVCMWLQCVMIERYRNVWQLSLWIFTFKLIFIRHWCKNRAFSTKCFIIAQVTRYINLIWFMRQMINCSVFYTKSSHVVATHSS